MNTIKTLAAAIAVSAAFAGAAQAGELDWPLDAPNATSLTRAQVVADLRDARAQGLVTTSELAYPPVAQQPATQVSRAQVRQELSAAQAAGLDASGELDYPPVAG